MAARLSHFTEVADGKRPELILDFASMSLVAPREQKALLRRRRLWQVPEMPPLRQGSFRIFRFAGIDVFLHWSWFLLAFYDVSQFSASYGSMVWPVLLFLCLFLIVLMHEFGHALACRQVGGEAHRIVLWPLGGIAFVSPPQRPGATLWSIAAGPWVTWAWPPFWRIWGSFGPCVGLRGGSPDASRSFRG